MSKKVGFVILIAVLAVLFYYRGLLGYALMQGKGQLAILWQAEPIEQVLMRATTPDSTKQRLRLVNEIRHFAFDSLGLTPTTNYTTFYNQHGQPVLWVVTACAPYRLSPKEWQFPVIGSFSYKGFFNKEKAEELATQLHAQGYDVELSPVNGWSTLGWFKDPVLSNMLEGSVGSLANTLLHELTHGTLFIPDSMTFNENLASFVGQRGALAFLAHTYGANSSEVQAYTKRIADSRQFTRFMVAGARQLDSLYQAIAQKPTQEKEKFKQAFMANFVSHLDTLQLANPKRFQAIFSEKPINNAGFISFLKYRERQHVFQQQLDEQFKGNLRAFIAYWKNKHPIKK